MRRIVPAILTLLMLASCTKQEATISSDDAARRDSLALHVAVVPVMDCMPIYYAQRMGMFDSLGVDVRLLEFQSLMDVDTALNQRHAQLGYTSLPRLVIMEQEGKDTLHEVAGLEGKLYLLTAHTKRIRNLKQLKERMVALERHSAADYWSDQLMKEAALDQADIYRPQFNDIGLRTTMLTSQLVDAALLPEPQASIARFKGNRQIAETNDSTVRLSCIACTPEVLSDSLRKTQQERFLKAYDKAVNALNKKTNPDTIAMILRKDYRLSHELADSIVLPKFQTTSEPSPLSRQTVINWIKGRQQQR